MNEPQKVHKNKKDFYPNSYFTHIDKASVWYVFCRNLRNEWLEYDFQLVWLDFSVVSVQFLSDYGMTFYHNSSFQNSHKSQMMILLYS